MAIKGYFNESFVCETKSFNTELSKEDILKQLKKNTISCKEVTFSIFGVSLASINTIFSFVLFCIFFNMFKKYENNK